MRPTLKFLEDQARHAGEIVRAGFGTQFSVEHKDTEIDLVTDVDRRSEEYLVGAIRAAFPTHSILAEENGALPGLEEHGWFVDPLDGTVNFTHGVPVFSVTLAYAQNGEVKLGVVYDPLREECYLAERGVGAWLNGQQLQVSSTPDLGQSLLVTGFPYDKWTHPRNNLDYFNRFLVRTHGLRRLGSAALDLCYVAAGRFDGYWELRMKAWDVAAGALIVQEAGGVVTGLHGEEDLMRPPGDIVAANPHIHPQMLDVLGGEG